jgi:ubiquitin-activating enzyme E1
LYVLGHEAMHKMAASKILIIGLNSLGTEIAKNIVLAGVKSVSLFDNTDVTAKDLVNFFLSPSDIGKPNKAACVFKHLAELNPYVNIEILDYLQESKEFISNFNAIVCTQPSWHSINAISHSLNIPFICASTMGLFSQVFCDFGSRFIVSDVNGENPIEGIIANITTDNKLEVIITCLDDHRHRLEDGDYVTFSELKAATELNDIKTPMKIRVIGPFSFAISLPDGVSLSPYKMGGGGKFHQAKMPAELSFLSWEESWINPEPFFITDFAKMERPIQYHVAFTAVNLFSREFNRLPKPRNDDDASRVFLIAQNVVKKLSDQSVKLDENLIKQVSYQAQGELSPMSAVIGGFVAQEALKAISGKFSPVKQWMYFDSLESLPSTNLTEEECQPLNCRYDGQIVVFGKTFNESVLSSKQFLVGAGAIGCEMLKNWAMMGLGSKGEIHVTDMDTIEVSNLNRQFLFRSKDVGKPKSECASNAIVHMNSDLAGHVFSKLDRVGVETENIFNDNFWNNITCVTNALDNVQASIYFINYRTIC